MKKNRLLSLLLAAMMLFGLLAGCGGDPAGGTPSSASPAQSPSNSGSQAPASQESAASPVELTVVTS